MTDMEFIESLMAHPNHFKPRTKAKWPISTSPPRCRVCAKQLAPGIDHTTCKESE